MAARSCPTAEISPAHVIIILSPSSAPFYAKSFVCRRSEFIAGERRHVRHGGQILLEILSASGGRFATQIVHGQHHRQLFTAALARNWLTE